MDSIIINGFESKSITDFIYWLIGLVVTIFLWYFSRNDLIRFFRKYNPLKKIKREEILDLEKSYLIIENKEFLNDRKVSNKYRYIIWPVTPTDSPNLIHVLSLYYLGKLSEYGLRVIVFVYDSYYEMIKHKTPKLRSRRLRNLLLILKALD